MIAAIESQHVAFAESATGDTLPTAVADSRTVQQVLEQAATQGIVLDALFSEAQCLPLRADQAVGLFEQGRGLIRLGRSRGLALEASALSSWLDHAGPKAADIHWFNADAEQADGEHLTRPVLAWLAAHLPGRDVPNLLQGRFAPVARAQAFQSNWRWAAGLVAGLVLLAFAHLGLERSLLKQHVEERQLIMEELLRQAVPGVQRIVDPVGQLRAALGQQASGQDALALLGRLAPLLVGSSAVQLEALEYRGGVMELVVLGPDVAATPGSRGVEGRLRVSEVAP